MASMIVSIKKFAVHLQDGKSRRIANDDRCVAREVDGLVTIDLSDGPFVLKRSMFDSLVETGVIVIEQNGGD